MNPALLEYRMTTKKAKVILTVGKGNLIHPAVFMKNCRKTVHNVK